jgi:hypothetical protein
VILWKDFILDDEIGPCLVVGPAAVVRGSSINLKYRKTWPNSSSVMEDAHTIQETRQEQRPARMAGLSSLDSLFGNGMEADRAEVAFERGREHLSESSASCLRRQRGEG